MYWLTRGGLEHFYDWINPQLKSLRAGGRMFAHRTHTAELARATASKPYGAGRSSPLYPARGPTSPSCADSVAPLGTASRYSARETAAPAVVPPPRPNTVPGGVASGNPPLHRSAVIGPALSSRPL